MCCGASWQSLGKELHAPVLWGEKEKKKKNDLIYSVFYK